MGWLEKVLEQTDELEPPQDFFYWAGLAAIAAVVKGNVFLDRFSYVLYPNIFVLLVADSGMRKGVPINFAKKLVSKINNNRVISGRNTIEAIVNTLSKDYTLEGGGMIKKATGFLVASEFATLIQENDLALTILTDLYDSNYHDEDGWKNTLKTQGQETLRGVNLSMLGASNQEHLEEILQSRDIKGGFIARTYLIHGDKKHRINSLVYKPKKMVNYDELVGHLQVLAGLRGQFEWHPDAAKYYDDWYKDYNKRQEKREHKDETGSSNRFEDHVLKVAMLIALADRGELELTVPDIEKSLDVCHQFLFTVDKLMITPKKGVKNINAAKIVLRELLLAGKGKGIKRSQILQRYWGEINAQQLDQVIDIFNSQNNIKTQASGKDTLYILANKTYDKLIKGA